MGKDAPHQAIRMAQYKVTEALQECYLSATSIDLENMGRQHLSPSAYTTLGLRVAQTVLYLLGEESYYRGPSVFGATLVDDTTIDVRISHRGGLRFYAPKGDKRLAGHRRWIDTAHCRSHTKGQH